VSVGRWTAATLLLMSAPARAAPPVTAFPLCAPPAAATVGAAATYAVEVSAEGTRVQRLTQEVALVARRAGHASFETELTAPAAPAMTGAVVRLELPDHTRTGSPVAVAIQVADNPPMDATAQYRADAVSAPVVDPAAARAAGTERLTFAGKPLDTTRYLAVDAHGLNWTLWCSPAVQPLGVVRAEARGSFRGGRVHLTMTALRARPTGARPRIVAPATARYDDATLFQQLMVEVARPRRPL
jgi:hypothetical protein